MVFPFSSSSINSLADFYNMQLSHVSKDTARVVACEPVLKKTKVLSLFCFGVFYRLYLQGLRC